LERMLPTSFLWEGAKNCPSQFYFYVEDKMSLDLKLRKTKKDIDQQSRCTLDEFIAGVLILRAEKPNIKSFRYETANLRTKVALLKNGLDRVDDLLHGLQRGS